MLPGVFNVLLVCVGVCDVGVMCWCVLFDVQCDGVWVVVVLFSVCVAFVCAVFVVVVCAV